MSNHAMTWAQRQRVGSIGAKFILCVFADYADKDGISWPGHEVLAETTEQSIRSVVRHIEFLIAGGWLREVGRADEGRNSRKLYQLVAPADALNPADGKRAKRHATVSHRDEAGAAADDASTGRVVAPEKRPPIAPAELQERGARFGVDDTPGCHVVNSDDTPTTTERHANHDTTTRQPRHRSIEDPSEDPSLIHHPALPVPDAAREGRSGEAVKVIAEFDRSIVQHFGPERARGWPTATDRVTAARWLEAGADLALAADVFNARHARMAAEGEDPPRSLRFHDLAMADAIKAAHRPMPEGSGFTSGLPPSVYDRQIEDAVAKALGGKVS